MNVSSMTLSGYFFPSDFLQKGEKRGGGLGCAMPAFSLRNIYHTYVKSKSVDMDNLVSDSKQLYYIPKINNIQSMTYEYFTDLIKKETTNSILNMFELQKDNGKVYAYLSERMHDFLEDDPEAYFDDSSFIGLYQFTKTEGFERIDFSLQLGEYGRACLQRTFKRGFVYIEFFGNDYIFYNIMTQNTDILKKGTFYDFFKHLAENPVEV